MSDNEFEISDISKQEWSYFIDSDDIGVNAVHIEISAPKDAFNALSKRLNVHSINEINAKITLQRNGVSKVIHVNGTINADLYQKCVITTEPVQEIISEDIHAWFADPNGAVSFAKAKRERMSRKEQNQLPIIEEHEDPEKIIDGKIDLGELVVQHISLALNPYPRTAGSEYSNQDSSLDDEPDGMYDNPFAALKDWKDKESKKESKKEK